MKKISKDMISSIIDDKIPVCYIYDTNHDEMIGTDLITDFIKKRIIKIKKYSLIFDKFITLKISIHYGIIVHSKCYENHKCCIRCSKIKPITEYGEYIRYEKKRIHR